jgi:uncharacterized protein (TIGR03086 family)
MTTDFVDRHRRACDGFAAVARRSDPDWDAQSPCDEWDARAVVEHVIGFHEMLVLRPAGVRAHRPRTGPSERWDATQVALFEALARPEVVEAPGIAGVLPTLSTDVLVHTWDLARAFGVEVVLDRELVDLALRQAGRNADALASSGMYAPPTAVDAGASAQARMLAAYGRRPG